MKHHIIYLKKTKDDRYLSILTLNAGIYSSWYKEFKLKFMGNIVQSRQPQREYFKSYTDNDPTTLNYSLLLPTLTDIEKAYIKVGKRFYRTEYDWLAPYIIYNKEKKELDIDTFHKFTMSTYASNADTIIVKTIHTAVFKYILSQTNKK